MAERPKVSFWKVWGYTTMSLVVLLVLGLAFFGLVTGARTYLVTSPKPVEVAVQEQVAADPPSAEVSSVEEADYKAAEEISGDTSAVNSPEPVRWSLAELAKYFDTFEVGGNTWVLPLGTHSAVDTSGGRYEAVESGPVGVVGGKDYGWCADDQLDCPPHALLVRVEVPSQFVSCMSAEMDISWRIMLGNDCGETVPVRFAIRYNDQTRTESKLKSDYLALAGLTQQPLDTLSEVGLFVSVRESGMGELAYAGQTVSYGYSCWDCLADTEGVGEPVPVPLSVGNFSTFGPDTSPSASTLIPGVVFPLPRPDDDPFTLEFELQVVGSTVVWAGRYDVSDPPG